MFSEPQTPSTFLEDSFAAETKPLIFDIGVGGSETIQAKLNKRLGPEYVSQRPAPGGGPKLTYVEGWKIIGLANEVFGYNGWCSTVTKIETDFVDMDPETRRYNIGVTAIVRVTLKDGTCHEDVGYGTGENMKSKGAALDKAKKEAVTDAVKRALRNFGNLLGLCLYEKSFTQEVVKIKPQPAPKLDESDLHRRTRSVSIPPTAGSSHDVSSSSFSEPHYAGPSVPPQIRPAISKPSPLRNPVMDARIPRITHENEQRNASSSRTGDTTGSRSTPSRQQVPPGNRVSPQNGACPPHPDRTLPHHMQRPQQGSSTSTSSHRQFDRKPVAPPLLKASDSDDIYFNDEDNDALLAIEDSAIYGVESSNALATTRDSAQGRAGSAGRDLTSESTRPQAATSVSTSSNRMSAPPTEPMSKLRRAIRASTPSSAAAGVKRPAESMQSPYPQPIGTSSGQQQQRSTGNNTNREPLSDIPIQGTADTKRMKR